MTRASLSFDFHEHLVSAPYPSPRFELVVEVTETSELHVRCSDHGCTVVHDPTTVLALSRAYDSDLYDLVASDEPMSDVVRDLLSDTIDDDSLLAQMLPRISDYVFRQASRSVGRTSRAGEDSELEKLTVRAAISIKKVDVINLEVERPALRAASTEVELSTVTTSEDLFDDACSRWCT